MGILPSDTPDDEVVSPLDLKRGYLDQTIPNQVEAELEQIRNLEDLPPINSMYWLTVIEEVLPN